MPAEKRAKYIPTEQVNAFALLFHGNASIHYVRTEKGKYFQKNEPATTEDYLRHLRGEYPSLLISPIVPGGKCFLVGGDIDRHDPENDTPVDVVALAKQVSDLNLPLIVTRSKNGRGAWLWLFFLEADGFDAATAIHLMRLYLEILSLDKDAQGKPTEVFPKQSDVAEDKSGNGLNLPFFGDEREGYGVDGERLDLEGFLKLAAVRAKWGTILTHRDLDVTVRDHEVSGGPVAAGRKLHEEVALPGHVLRELYKQALDKLALAVKGNWTVTLNATGFLSSRIFASGVLDSSEKDIQAEIRQTARKARPSEVNSANVHASTILEKAWRDGIARPFTVLDPQAEHDAAFHQIDQLLHDEGMEVTQYRAVMLSATKLTALEYDALRQRIARRLKMSAEDFDEHVSECRPKKVAEEKDELEGQRVIFEDTELYPEEVAGAQLLTDMSDIFRKYIFFYNPTNPNALSAWTLGTHGFSDFDIFARIGVTAPDENSGKSTVLKVILRLAHKPFPGVAPTAAVIYRAIESFGAPTILVDEGDNTFYSKASEDLMAILNSGHEKDLAFVARNVPVGDGYEVRRFSTWSPMAYAMIGRPRRTLLSRSIEIPMRKAKVTDAREDLPRLRFTPPIFMELRQKCARWAADNVKKLADVKVEKILLNRAGDNWEPLLQIATLVGGGWPERIVLAAKSDVDADVMTAAKSELHILLKDVRDVFFTRKVDEISPGLLLADLLLQTESPWQRIDRGQPLNPNVLGRMLAEFRIESKPRKQKALEGMGERVSVRWYMRADFDDLFDRYLADVEPRLVPVTRTDDPSF